MHPKSSIEQVFYHSQKKMYLAVSWDGPAWVPLGGFLGRRWLGGMWVVVCVGGVPMWVFGGFPCRSPWWFVGRFCGRLGLWVGVGGVVLFVGGSLSGVALWFQTRNGRRPSARPHANPPPSHSDTPPPGPLSLPPPPAHPRPIPPKN
jgi:hypothetical protein